MSEFCSSGSHMSCGAVCIFARALIWQEGPGVLISDLSLTFTWQFEAVGKGCVGEPVMSCLSPSGSLRAFLLMLEPALRGMLQAVPADPQAASWLSWPNSR